MRYFQLRDDMTTSNRWYLGEIVLDDGSEPRLMEGIPLVREGTLRAAITHPGPRLDFFLTSFGIPVTSRQIAEVIGTVAGSDLQRLPIRIEGEGGMEVLNAVRLVRCVDDSRSRFIKWTEQDHRADLAGQYRQISTLRLKPDAVPPDAHFFRIEGWPVALVVSEDVRTAMMQYGCHGAKFDEIPS